MTEFENNVRLLRYWRKQQQCTKGSVREIAEYNEEKYARLVDNYLDELISPSIKFE